MSNPDQSPATVAELVEALRQAEAGLEVAVAHKPQTTGFVPSHVLALQIVKGVLSRLPTEAAAMAATVPAGQLYFALNNLLTHLGLEGSIDADHGFVWDTMTALKRIDGGVYLDNLAVPTEPDAHRDDMLAAVRMLEDGEWAEHFAKTPIGKRLEDAVTKLHSDLNDAQAPVAGQPAEPSPLPDRPGIYAWCSGMAAALVLVNKRPSDHAPGGQLNGHVMASTRFYDGCAVADWGRDGGWTLLHDDGAAPKGDSNG